MPMPAPPRLLLPPLVLLLVACGPEEEASSPQPDAGDAAVNDVAPVDAAPPRDASEEDVVEDAWAEDVAAADLPEDTSEADVAGEADAVEDAGSVGDAEDADVSDTVEDSGAPDAVEDASDVSDADTLNDASCTPDCSIATCGDDGCGGSCGECATECVDGACVPEVACPPEGPYGTAEGDAAMDYILTRCDGSSVTVHELCGNDANLIVGFAGWCPPCIAHAPLWQSGFEARGDASLGMYFVVNETNLGATPDAAYCTGTMESFGLTIPVLFDPTGGFASAFGIASNDSTIVLNAELQIIDKGQYRAPDTVFADIDELLGE